MKRFTVALLATTALLSACGEDDRREFLYKPAYCLAGGLAQVGTEACLPKKLKEDAVAVAQAKLTEPTAPTVAKHVYYTEDQRLAMGLVIADRMFTPTEKLTRSSTELSLEANDLLPALDCKKKKLDTRLTNEVAATVTPRAINRETAKFLSEHYSDLQLSELYRVANDDGTIADVPDDAFLIPDPKNAAKTVNVKPQPSRAMGSILSYTTSRTVSQQIAKDKASIAATIETLRTEPCAIAPAPAEGVTQ